MNINGLKQYPFYTPFVPNYKTPLEHLSVPKYKPFCKFLDALIIIFPNISLINTSNLYRNMKSKHRMYLYTKGNLVIVIH